MLALAPAASAATKDAPKDIRSLRMIRYEFDNDTFLGSDDGFTAGWSLQLHSRLMDTWNGGFANWIGRVPGLGDDGEGRRIVRWATSLSQSIITPSDITIAAPQPDAAPWAGILGVHTSWSSYDNRRLAALQVYLGCMGPCAQAEDVQTFIHDGLGMGSPPKGWANQLDSQLLVNLNYEYRYKLYAADVTAYVPGRFAADIAVGGHAGVGNFVTSVRGQFEFRLGWGLPMGFTKTPDPSGFGVVTDPVYFEPGSSSPELKRWRIYLTLVTRAGWIGRLAPAEGGETEIGGFHSGLEAKPGRLQALAGLNVDRLPVGFHVTYYRYFESQNIGVTGSADWVNVSIEFRF